MARDLSKNLTLKRTTSQSIDYYDVTTSLRNQHQHWQKFRGRQYQWVDSKKISSWRAWHRSANDLKLTGAHHQARLQLPRKHANWMMEKLVVDLFPLESRMSRKWMGRARVYRRFSGRSTWGWYDIRSENGSCLHHRGEKPPQITSIYYATLLPRFCRYTWRSQDSFVKILFSWMMPQNPTPPVMPWPARSPDLYPIEHL